MKLSSIVCVTEQKNTNTGNIQTEFIEYKVSNWTADQYVDTGSVVTVLISCRWSEVKTGEQNDWITL